MTATFDCDFAHNEQIKPVLLALRKFGGTIVDFDPDGPAGGNPVLLLDFPDRTKAVGFLLERYPDDSREFSESRVRGG